MGETVSDEGLMVTGNVDFDNKTDKEPTHKPGTLDLGCAKESHVCLGGINDTSKSLETSSNQKTNLMMYISNNIAMMQIKIYMVLH